MKFILVPVLMMLILTQTFGKWLVVMEYNMNRNFVAKNLCVNRARPKLNCNGKCQMMKRLAEEEKQNSAGTTNNPSRIKIQELLFSDETGISMFSLVQFSKPSYNEHQAVSKYNAPVPGIFHPPSIN